MCACVCVCSSMTQSFFLLFVCYSMMLTDKILTWQAVLLLVVAVSIKVVHRMVFDTGRMLDDACVRPPTTYFVRIVSRSVPRPKQSWLFPISELGDCSALVYQRTVPVTVLLHNYRMGELSMILMHMRSAMHAAFSLCRKVSNFKGALGNPPARIST